MNQDEAATPPLKPQVFEVLLTLADGPRHGYAIMHEVEERTRGRVRVLPGTLYRFLHRLVEEGLLLELPEASGGDDTDRKRRTYKLTARGHEAVRAETERLQATLEVALAMRVLDTKGHA